MNKRFSEDVLYYIEFYDHAYGINEAITVKVVGWCIKDTKEYAVFSSWKVISNDKDIVDNNHEPFTIVKSCIRRKKKLSC